MKKILLLFLFLTIGCTKHVLVIGDSITYHGGYVQFLVDKMSIKKYPNNTTFTVYGYPSKGTRYIREQYEKIDLTKYSDIIILAGVNNISDPDAVIYDLMLMYQRGKNKRVIALTLTPWKNYPTWTPQKQKNTEEVNNFIKNVFSQKNYIPIDIYSALLTNEFGNVFEDGLHPNNLGHVIIGYEIYEKVYKEKKNGK